MTVRDIIAQLERLDPDTPVLRFDSAGDGQYRDVLEIRRVDVGSRQPNGSYPWFQSAPNWTVICAVVVE